MRLRPLLFSKVISTNMENNQTPPTTPISAPVLPEYITIDDFAKCKIKIGLITAAEKVPETERLIKLTIDCGEGRLRTIVSGIAEYYPDPSVLVGKRVPVLTNLAPRKMKGIESEGMVLYAVGTDTLTALEPNIPMPPGTPMQ